MQEIQGKYNKAKVYASIIEDEAISQIHGLLDCSAFESSNIAFMPDAHAGKGCTIGTTMTIKDKVCPNLVGVDIGCGMLVAELGKINIDLKLFDKACHEAIRSGKNVYETYDTRYVGGADRSIYLRDRLLSLKTPLKSLDYIRRSIGTLGGGNHFVEIDADEDNNKYIVIHSGSRYLGIEVAKYFQKKAENELQTHSQEKLELIKKLKAEHREKDIQKELELFSSKNASVPKHLAYCEGELLSDYMHDIDIAQEYARVNRNAMLLRLIDFYNRELLNAKGKAAKDEMLIIEEKWETIHNYIDIKNKILRKGAVSAQKDEKLLIPMNMKDGSLICVGKGNADWNFSAPHGAGRIMSRSKAKEQLRLDDFKKSMEGIYTTTASLSTIDEAPAAYKPIKQILKDIKDTVDVVKVVKPVFNFKAEDGC